jgi:hypothetical protein
MKVCEQQIDYFFFSSWFVDGFDLDHKRGVLNTLQKAENVTDIQSRGFSSEELLDSLDKHPFLDKVPYIYLRS